MVITPVSFDAAMYLYWENGNRSENVSAELRAQIDKRYESHYTPEEILGYVYAILYAPTYRVCFAEFLRKDFPRVPFPNSAGSARDVQGQARHREKASAVIVDQPADSALPTVAC